MYMTMITCYTMSVVWAIFIVYKSAKYIDDTATISCLLALSLVPYVNLLFSSLLPIVNVEQTLLSGDTIATKKSIVLLCSSWLIVVLIVTIL